MSHLAEEYAKSCGVKIGKPVLRPHYFPILYDKYITIHNDKKVQSKEYDMWPEVIELLKPYLKDIKVIQIGAKGEETIKGVDAHMPTETLKQSAYLIENSLAHVGIDSVPVHMASALDKPVVGIYSHTYASTCSPLWNENAKAITIESDRRGNKPSFSLNENPKTINFINPEKIAQAVLDVLNIDEKINHETIYIGEHYKSNFFEIIPIKNTTIKAENIDVRMDYAHNENVLLEILKRNIVEVTLSKPIGENIIKSNRIKKIIYKADSFDQDFCKLIKKEGIPHVLVCTSSENLSEERTKNFDSLISHLDIKESIENSKKKINIDDFNKIKIKSNKQIVCGDKLYKSYFDLNERKNLDHFYVDLEFLNVYIDPDEQE
tara:strand:+ start:2269 stop:3399 length:1131 start_codon:yes stop_codon:yes gene_type:complete